MRNPLFLALLAAAATAVAAQQAYMPSMGGGDYTLPITSMSSSMYNI